MLGKQFYTVAMCTFCSLACMSAPIILLSIVIIAHMVQANWQSPGPTGGYYS